MITSLWFCWNDCCREEEEEEEEDNFINGIECFFLTYRMLGEVLVMLQKTNVPVLYICVGVCVYTHHKSRFPVKVNISLCLNFSTYKVCRGSSIICIARHAISRTNNVDKLACYYYYY